MKKILLLAFLISGLNSYSQTTIYAQDFETVGSGYVNTPNQIPSVDPGDQYFSIATPDDSNIYESGGQLYTNITNSSFFVGSNPNAINSGNPGTIVFDPIAVSAYTNLEFRADFGAVPNDWDASDNLEVQYNFDGGSWVTLVQFGHNSGTNAPLTLLSNANGGINTALGTVLTFDLQTIASNNFVGTGSTLNIRILVDANANYEAFAVDNVIVTGILAGGNPPPVISNISNSPISPTSADVVTVTADVTDNTLLNLIQIEYGFSTGVFDQMPISMSPTTGNTYSGDIPVQADGTEVFFRIVATDNDPMPATTTSAEQSYSVLDPITTSFVAVQDFDTSLPEWSIITNQGDVDANYGRSLAGTRISNGDVLELTSFDITGLQNLELTIHNASVGGIENADKLEVYVDLNGNGYPIDADITIQEEDTSDGSFNKSWSYDAANGNVASTIAGTPAIYNGDGDNGYSIIKISIPNNTTSIAVRIAAETNNNSEYFYIDDITLSEQASVIDYVYDGTSWSPTAPEGVSTTDDNVIVQSGSVSFTGDVDMNNLSLVGSSTLDLGANTLNIVGNVNSPAGTTIVASEASINLAGIDAQDIIINDVTLENLIINNANGATLNGVLNLEGVLTLSNGVLSTNDNLTLKSSAVKSAVVGPVLSGSVSGDVIVEQFYSNKRAYRLVGSTVTSSTSIFENWQQAGLNPGDMDYETGVGTHITGGAIVNGFDQSGSNAVSMFTYNNGGQVWAGITNTNSTNLTPGTPYRLFIRGDRSVSLFTANAPSTSTTLKTKGALANSFVDVNNLSSTEGAFNFIANPYQAQVNFATLMADSDTEDINTTMYYAWDPTIGDNGAYVTYDFGLSMNNVGGSEVNEFLQPGQAVFVRTSEDGNNVGLAPSMRFKQSFKISSTDINNVYRSSNSTELITISLFKNNELSTGKARDGVILKFDANQISVSGAAKLQNPDENLSIWRNNQSLSILRSTIPSDGDVINLDLNSLTGNDYTFNINNDFSSLQVILVDDYLMTETILNEGSNSVSFTIDAAQPNSFASSRFSIKFNNETLSVDDSAFAKAVKLYPNPLIDDASLTIENLDRNESVEINIFNSVGQMVKSYQKDVENGRVELNDLQTLGSGLYFLNLKQSGKTVLKRFMKQ